MLVGAGVAAAIVAFAAAALLIGNDSDGGRDGSDGGRDGASGTAIDEPAAAVRAREACERFDDLLQLVERNGPAPEANRLLDAMADAGTDASRLDPRWTQLASGMHALRLGFDEDDREATRIGVDLVRTGCAEVDR